MNKRGRSIDRSKLQAVWTQKRHLSHEHEHGVPNTAVNQMLTHIILNSIVTVAAC
jgi:hypothetical protein